MAKFSKYQKTSVGHLFKHYERGLDSKGEPVKYSNGSIDLKKSELNYNLANEIQPLGQKEYLDKRLSDKNLKVMKRKDVKVVCEWIITLPKDLSKDKEEEFFKTCFEFLINKYGIENVVSCFVHKDETTPHMHFAFIPVYFNEKKQEYRVSANDTIKRKDLKSFHKELQKYCEGKMGCEVNIENGATKNGNLTVEQLKANKKLEEATSKAKQEATQTKKVINEVLSKSLTLENEYNNILNKVDNISDRASKIKIDSIPDQVIKWVDEPTIAKFNDGNSKPYMDLSLFELIKKWISELTSLLGLSELNNEVNDLKKDIKTTQETISTSNVALNRAALSLDTLKQNMVDIHNQAQKTSLKGKSKAEPPKDTEEEH